MARVEETVHFLLGTEAREALRSHAQGSSTVTDYQSNCFHSEDDGGHIADIPDLDACSAFGDTPQEAVAAVLQAREAWLEAARASHRPIPPLR
jgi:predicted RNase H-like HicB family nuclease